MELEILSGVSPIVLECFSSVSSKCPWTTSSPLSAAQHSEPGSQCSVGYLREGGVKPTMGRCQCDGCPTQQEGCPMLPGVIPNLQNEQVNIWADEPFFQKLSTLHAFHEVHNYWPEVFIASAPTWVWPICGPLGISWLSYSWKLGNAQWQEFWLSWYLH